MGPARMKQEEETDIRIIVEVEKVDKNNRERGRSKHKNNKKRVEKLRKKGAWALEGGTVPNKAHRGRCSSNYHQATYHTYRILVTHSAGTKQN